MKHFSKSLNIINKKRILSIVSFLLSMCITASTLGNCYISAEANSSQSETTEETEADNIVETPEIKPNFTLTDDLRAATLVAGADFYDENQSESTLSTQLTSIYDEIQSIGLNSVYIKTVYDNQAYYNTEMNETDELDPIAIAVKLAVEKGLQVFLLFDLNYVVSTTPENMDTIDYLISETHKFALKYAVNGIIIDNYYSTDSLDSFNNYMQNGSGIGYKNWLYDISEYRFKTACDVIHLTDNTIAVGMLVNDMWANADKNELGSDTNDNYQAYYDGFSDTKAYIEKKYVDFVTVHAYGSLTDGNLAFENVSGWWGELAKTAEIPMYIVHHNEKLGGTKLGWNAEDQLLRQLAIAKESKAYSGSVFNSYSGLVDNTLSTTTTLTKYYNEQINVDSLFEDLKMTSPSYMNYTTYDSTVPFMGTFDENFDVYFDGEKLKLNEAGNFYLEEPLEVGMNKFTIKHKDKTLVYNIERTVNVIKSIGKSIGEGKTLTVEGGTVISLSAVAYKGASVTATLNGITVQLKESKNTDDVDVNSSYATFTGKITTPAGIVNQAQSLGSINITASYSGYTKTLMGASVTVKEIKQTVVEEEIEEEIKDDQSSVGTGEVVGKISAAVGEDEAVKLVKLLNDYTYVFDGMSTSAIITPDFGQLPAGTLDYYESSWGDYYTTVSGKRYNIEDASVIDGYGFGENKLLVKSVGSTGGDAYIKIQLDDKTSYRIEAVGNEYYSSYDGDYYLDSFTATHIYITFDNVTSVTKLPSFENSTVFSAGKWTQVKVNGIPKFRLVLTLRQAGVYAGNSGTYDSNGDLMLKFETLTNNIANMTIVIDPGHGVFTNDNGNSDYDPGAVGHIRESDANLAVAKQLEKKLKALGVNVVRLDTENKYYMTMIRPVYARGYGCDLYLALHSNKAASEDARGTEAYYFTPFSQPLASAVSASIASYFSNSVYSDGADKNRGAHYSYFWTTKQQDFPSVLVEMGFVSNYTDAMALASSTHQAGIADAIINGIKNYLSRSNLSVSTEGSDSVS